MKVPYKATSSIKEKEKNKWQIEKTKNKDCTIRKMNMIHVELDLLLTFMVEKSHKIVKQGLEILTNLTHRGATGYDPKLGDGAGLLIQLPDNFLRQETENLNLLLPQLGHYGVGMIFLPQSKVLREKCEVIILKRDMKRTS